MSSIEPTPFQLKQRTRGGAMLWLVLFTLLPASALAHLPGTVPSLAPMLDRVMPGVVSVATSTTRAERRNPLLDDPIFRRFFGTPKLRRRTERNLGSGVVIDAERGHVLTCHHVIEGADTINILLQDGRRLEGQLIGSDAATDLAVIKVAPEKLTAVPIAADQPRVGDFVVAIGNPFGLRHTVTSGIVSGIGRSGLDITGVEDFIQTDASINPGNSGGALVDLEGQLVGINSAILAPSGGNIGIGFAIPATLAQRVAEQLVEHGRVRRGQLGVDLKRPSRDLAQALSLDEGVGLVVTRVMLDSTADRMGLMPGDILLEFNRRPVTTQQEFDNRMGLLPLGTRLSVELMRRGRTLTVTGRLKDPKLTRLQGGTIHRHLRGILLGEARYRVLRGAEAAARIQVLKVSADAATDDGDLEPGDVIVAANRKPVEGLGSLKRILRRVRGQLLLEVHRGDEQFLLLFR